MHLLLSTMGAPLLGALVVVLIPARRHALLKGAALFHAGAALLLSLAALAGFRPGASEFQLAERLDAAGAGGVTYAIGVDGLSLPLVLLTTLLSLVAVVASLGIRHRVKGYFAWLLLLEFALLGVFSAQNWSLFYMFWELTLIPLFFLIGVWGGERRGPASMSLFLYTLGGSLFMLLALLALYLHLHTFDMAEMIAARGALSPRLQLFAFLGIFISVAVKIPVFPLHGWQPLAYLEAPTPVSLLLAGVLAKMGGYGLMRVTHLLPLGAAQLLPVLVGLALASILYGAVLAYRQTDLKAMVAYSSLSHMGFVLLGVASLNTAGFVGASLQMLTHGITTAALFLLVGALHERTRERDIFAYGGLARVAPSFSALMALALLASMGLPGLAGFVSELHTLAGGVERWGLLVAPAAVATLITAATSLRVLGRLLLGPVNPRWVHLRDLGPRELGAAAPLAALMVALGVAPGPALALMAHTLQQMTAAFP